MKKRLVDQVIGNITGRTVSMFQNDLLKNKEHLTNYLRDKSVLVIGGAGTIGSNFIKEILHFPIERLYVVDTNENGLAELIRDIRSSGYPSLPYIQTYPFSYGSAVFEKLFRKQGPFEIVANFAALKHVRTEKDAFAIEAMFHNNFILNERLLRLLNEMPPQRFFCVSTDKATNPVSIMGASKKLMEDIIFAYKEGYEVSTARFANVAFSNGSLMDSYIHRYNKNQPLVCPNDINRFFVSPQESGQLCLMACLLGKTGDIFIPKLSPETDLIPFKKSLFEFLKALDVEPIECSSDEEAREKAAALTDGNNSGYPVYLFPSDTSGEKPYEEFYGKHDTVDWNRFEALGVVETEINYSQEKAEQILSEARTLFSGKIDKSDIVAYLNRHISGFNYAEKGKTLDQRM